MSKKPKSNTLHTPGEWFAEPGGIEGDDPNRWCVMTRLPGEPNQSWFIAPNQYGASGSSIA